MPSLSHFEIQKAIYELLTADATLMGMVNSVYDRVTEGAEFPYIVIGESVSRDWSTKTTNGQQILLALHVYSRSGGRKQTAEILDRIYNLLHQGTVSLSGHLLIAMRFEFGDITLESDQLTYHGAIRFRAFTEELV